MPYGAVESLRCVHSAPKNANTGNEHACTAPRGLQPCPSSHGPAASESELNSALERNRNPASRRSPPRGELHALRVKPRNSKASRSHLSKRTSNILSTELRLPSLARYVCTDVGLGTSLQCSAGRRCFSRWTRPPASLGAEEVLPSDACVCCCGAAPRCEVLSAGAPLAARGSNVGLFAGCCGPGAAPWDVCAHGAPGGTGCAAAAFAAPAAAARCPCRWQWAAESFLRRHASHLTAVRVPGGRPCPGIPHKRQSEDRSANAFGSHRCVFAPFRPIASAKETHAKRCFFFSGGTRAVLMVAQLSHVTFCFANSRGFKACLNATKWPRVQPKLARAALHGFFFSLPRAYTGVRSHNGTRKRFPR